MVSLRGIQSTSSVMETESLTSTSTSTASALTSATEGTSSTGTATTMAASTAPSSRSRSVTTKKETTSSGELITTVTTSTTTVSTSTSNATSNTTSSTSSTASNGERTTATERNAGSVSTTTITTTEFDNGSSPVTTVTKDNGVNTTSTSTTKDAITGITTVTTTTKSDTDINGSASSSTTLVATSSGSSGALGAAKSTTTTETSNAAGSSASTSTTAPLSSAEATMMGASSSTTSTSTSTATAGNPTSLITETSNGSTTGTTTSTEGTWASATSGTTTNSANSATTSSANGAATNTASPEERSSTTTTTISTDGNDSGSKASSSATATSTTSTAMSSEGSTSSTETPIVGYGSTLTSAVSSSNSSSTSTSTSTSSSSSLVSWFTSNVREDETQLVVGAMSSTTTAGASYQVCDGLPALVTRSSTEAPNGGCPDELTALNASCTCLTGYSETASSWTFHVTTESWNSTTNTTTRSLTQSSSSELDLNTIRPIWVSSSLETLVIEGAGAVPVEIEFIDENRVASGSSLTLVRSVNNSTSISTLALSNLDLNSVAETNSDFVPATVTNLTLRNCNISTLSTSFTRDWSSLQYLDLSSNNIDTAYIDGAGLKELNLSHNALAVFPAASLNSSGLQALYIQGNNITDFNVSQEEFEQIQGLTGFTADQPKSSSSCQGGAWQSAHGITFCVLGVSTAAAPDSSRSAATSSDDDHGGLGLVAYWLIGGAIIVFFLLLLVLWQRRRHSRERESSPMVSPDALEPTTPMYNGEDAFDDALNRDAADAPPAVAPGSRPSEIYVGYGRSHGNSVDSEDTALGVDLASNPVLAACRLDYGEVALGRCISRGGFGLVFVGSYRGRQVAVKKIRNERGVNREQVEQFEREISLISGLHHPRIVEFIGACWTTPAELSAVTELMERGDLRDVTRRFKRRGYRLTWEAHKAGIALNIAEALTYLHGLSPTVIHRDLKAKNVMLNADMEAKLSDFGIARERSFYDGSEHMTVGIGTSFWIAPEVLLGRDYDERADIYSFGVVLSEIDTDDYPYWNAQHPPQDKMQENEILRLVARGAKRPAFSDDCPPAILELAARCLRTDPEERPSATEIVLYLQELVQERNSDESFQSMPRPGNSLDVRTRISSPRPTRSAPANTIVNLRSSGQQIQQNQAMTAPSSAAADYAAGNRTTTTTTTKVTSSSNGAVTATISRPTTAEALSPAHEVVVASPRVTHQVVRTKLPLKGKRTATTTRTRQAEQGSLGKNVGGLITSRIVVGSPDGDSDGEDIPSSQSHTGLPPTSPASARASHQAALDNLNQQRQRSSSTGQEVMKPEVSSADSERQWQRWVVKNDVKEL